LDFFALMIASFTLAAVAGAAVGALLGFHLWGWIGAVLGIVVGYGAGVWYEGRYAGVPLSPNAKGWLSLFLFLAGLTILAIATR
jgi:hypothetical protein